VRRRAGLLDAFGSLLARAACLASVAACGTREAPARPQLVVVIDSDAPIVSQLSGHPEISSDATIDTVRIDVLGADNVVREVQEIVALDSSSWPITFGVVSDADATRAVTLRVRAFRGSFASPGSAAGKPVLDPPREASIDRLATIALPTSDVHVVRIVLRSDCMGTPVSFVARTTCVDAARRTASETEGLEVDPPDRATTQVGTWPRAREVPCQTAEVRGAKCIKGGVTLLGELAAQGLDRGLEPTPLLPVIVSPFWLDETEVTVGRFRELLKRAALKGPLPDARVATDRLLEFCTWLGPNDATNDDLPLNCVSWATAAEICGLLGGSLPTEAEWEHAARGRGERRAFPWGEIGPACCTASVGRVGLEGFGSACSGSGLEAVRSHPALESCGGIGDVSRDGVLDLGGSVTEWTRDAYRPYSHRCWGTGITTDPVCEDGEGVLHTRRGGSWSEGPFLALAALRRTTLVADNETGLRCRYKGLP
jgi:formylglycine-generating enzyme required for sulfatase activity